MPNDSMRTVLVALGSGLGVALAKVAVAVVTGSAAMAAEASHSLADTANDFFLFVAQRRSSRRPDDRYPLGYAVTTSWSASGCSPPRRRRGKMAMTSPSHSGPLTRTEYAPSSSATPA